MDGDVMGGGDVVEVGIWSVSPSLWPTPNTKANAKHKIQTIDVRRALVNDCWILHR